MSSLEKQLRTWRALHPVTGVRAHLLPPPGWRAPKDWATYPRPTESLLPDPAPGMAPPSARKWLDRMLGERGRLIYDCDPSEWLGGICRHEP